MKIKLFCALSLVLAISVSGCTMPLEPDEAFAPVLEDYRALVQNDFYTELLEDYDAYNESTGEYIGNEFRLYRDSLYYSYHDIDGNGTPELAVAGTFSSVESAPHFFSIYAHNGDEPVRLFPEYEFGERINLTLLEEGIIRVDYSNSAFESGVDFYKLASDGITPEKTSSYLVRSENHDDGSADLYYTENGESITEAEYTEATKPNSPIKLDWKIIE